MAGTPKLIILSEQLRGQQFELINDTYACGRTDSSDICIADPTISTHHCDIVKRDGMYVLVDNNSTNGTRVNNIPITEQTLQNTDILQLGGIEILYDCDDKSMTSVIKTQTGITLQGHDIGVSTVNQMDNFDPFANKSGGGKSQKIVKGIVILLIVSVIILLGVLAWIMFIKPKNKTTNINHNDNSSIVMNIKNNNCLNKNKIF